MKLGRIALTVVAIAALSGCAVMEPATPPDAMSAPSEGTVSIMERSGVGGLPAGWEPWILHPTKRKTRYETRGRNGDTVIWAHAESAASGLARRLNLDPAVTPWIEWRWRVESLVAGADNTDRYAEDSPVRIVLAFDGDRRKLPARDQLFFEKARLLSGGQEMPYATLMYIWENRQPVNAVITNPNTSRVRKIVVSSGEAGVGTWQNYRRNIIEDYRRAYGNDPGRLIGVAILTDTDNTRQTASAQYGKIRLLEK